MDEEIKPVEEQVTETVAEEAKQEELPLAVATEETAEAEQPVEQAEEKPAEKTEEPKEDWRDRELKAKYRRQKDLERQLEEERKRREAAEELAAKFNQTTQAHTPVVSIDEVDKRAKELLAQQQYLENCNKTAQDGEKTYGEGWKEAVSNLEILGGFDPATMNGLLATDAPSKVIFELGKNPDRYHQIMQLPLEKRIIEMGKLAMQPTQKAVSNAPAPINPVGGRAAPAAQTLNDNLDDDKWYQVRLAQKRAKWAANNRAR